MAGILLYLAGSMLLGICFCFWGRRHYSVLLGLLTFLSVFSVRAEAVGVGLRALWPALAAGVLSAVFARFFYRLGVFLLCALAGAGLGLVLGSYLPLPQNGEGLVVLVFAALLGILSLFWSDGLLMLTTAFTGAALLCGPAGLLIFEFGRVREAAALGTVFDGISSLQHFLEGGALASSRPAAVAAATLVAALAGLACQRRSARRED